MKILIYIILFVPWLIHFLIFPSDDFFIPLFNSIELYLLIFSIIYSLTTYSFYKIIKENKVDRNFLFSYIGFYLVLQSTYIFYPILTNSLLFIILLILISIFNIMFYIQTKKHLSKEHFLIIPSIVFNTVILIIEILNTLQIIDICLKHFR